MKEFVVPLFGFVKMSSKVSVTLLRLRDHHPRKEEINRILSVQLKDLSDFTFRSSFENDEQNRVTQW